MRSLRYQAAPGAGLNSFSTSQCKRSPPSPKCLNGRVNGSGTSLPRCEASLRRYSQRQGLGLEVPGPPPSPAPASSQAQSTEKGTMPPFISGQGHSGVSPLPLKCSSHPQRAWPLKRGLLLTHLLQPSAEAVDLEHGKVAKHEGIRPSSYFLQRLLQPHLCGHRGMTAQCPPSPKALPGGPGETLHQWLMRKGSWRLLPQTL